MALIDIVSPETNSSILELNRGNIGIISDTTSSIEIEVQLTVELEDYAYIEQYESLDINNRSWKTAVQQNFVNMRNIVGQNTPIIMTQFQGMGGAGLRDSNYWNYSGMKFVARKMLDIFEVI